MNDNDYLVQEQEPNISEHTSYPPISIIIPAYNEEKAIASQIEAVKNVLNTHTITYELIVVDDGSSDDTAKQAKRSDVCLIHHPENRGYGASLKTGISAAKNETIVIIDADVTYPAEAIPSLLTKAQKYDMVVGARTAANAQVPFVRKPAKWFLRTLASQVSVAVGSPGTTGSESGARLRSVATA